MATKSSDKSSVKTAASAAKSRTTKDKAKDKATTKPADPTSARGKKVVVSTKPVAKSSTKTVAKVAPKATSKPATKTPAKAAVSKATPPAKQAVAPRTSKSVTTPAVSKPVAKAKPAPVVVEPPVEPPVELSDEERELLAVYGDDIGQPALAHGEFKDQRTADEDRPMTPEISARDERNKRWDERRDERRDTGRRHRRERGRDRSSSRDGAARPEIGGGNGSTNPNSARPPREVVPATPRPEAAPTKVGPLVALMVAAIDAGPHRVGTSAGDGAAVVFAQLRNAQPMPVKQLAAMMRKRGLIEGDPEVMWPGLKSALLADERSYRALGLRPRLVYRGRDQFGPGPVTQSASGAAEAALAGALSGVAAATHTTLRQKIAGANSAGFERLCDAYLTAAGYRDLVWLKRVDGISYATALPPQGERAILISARSGDTQVDRRGVGELRVGVDAKGLLYGLLLSARELSTDAERELERPGRSIQVLGGDALVGALVSAGVGVVAAAAPVRYVDDQLLDELLAG